MPEQIAVPELQGQRQSDAEKILVAKGLKLGPLTHDGEAAGLAGSVMTSTPASGTLVEPGSYIALTIAGTQVAVPDLSGLNLAAAKKMLRNAGLVADGIQRTNDDTIPAGEVIGTSPKAQSKVDVGDAVLLHLSKGKATVPAQTMLNVLFSVMGVVILGAIASAIAQKDGSFLSLLSQKNTAQGLITFLIAISTVSIAVILAISTIVMDEGPESAQRFDRGKQVLVVLIGVLGTIVGFYYGAAPALATSPHLAIESKALPEGALNAPFDYNLSSTGGKSPVKWTVDPALPSKLELNGDTGKISGASSETADKKAFIFTVTDSSNPPLTEDKRFYLTIK